VDDVSPEAFAREYSALIDRYVPLSQPVYVIGESFGGLVGAALARLRPDRVSHLILLAWISQTM
jgi:pimeloyl-ACP methyl ester carboxylesterase